MRVIRERPPNWDAIIAVFPLVATRPGVIFAWGEVCFAPIGTVLTPSLEAHESVHGARQGADIEGWWTRYLAEPAFRLAEEIPAHAEEWRVLRPTLTDRTARRWHLRQVAERLSGRLYGNLLTFERAKRLIGA